MNETIKINKPTERRFLMNSQVTNVWQGYVSFWKNYANFKGRARRMEFFGAMLFNVIICIICIVGFLLLSLITRNTIVGIVGICLLVIYGLVIFIPNLAVTFRRLHDTGKSGVNYLWGFIPGSAVSVLSLFNIGTVTVGIILSVCAVLISIPFLVWLVTPGTEGENKYDDKNTSVAKELLIVLPILLLFAMPPVVRYIVIDSEINSRAKTYNYSKANEAVVTLSTIANQQHAFKAENGRFLTCVYHDNCWRELGFEHILPRATDVYWTFEVRSDEIGFVATATLRKDLVNVPVGSFFTIDNNNNRTVSNRQLQAVIPNWANQ